MMLHPRVIFLIVLFVVPGFFLVVTTILHLCLTEVNVRDPLKHLPERIHHSHLSSRCDLQYNGIVAADANVQQPLKDAKFKSRELKSVGSLKSVSHPSHSSLYKLSENDRRNLRLRRDEVIPSTKSQRELFEAKLNPEDAERVRASVDALRTARALSQPNMPYDVYHCPADPPDGYPMSWPLVDKILSNWNVDHTDIPESIYQGLCVFDWETDQERAETYRRAEVPFVVVNYPEVLRTTERWNHPNYLKDMIGPKPQRADHSKSSHFMFWRNALGVKIPDQWEPPTDEVKLTFDEWQERAEELQSHHGDPSTMEHWYLRLNANYNGLNSYLYDELPMLAPQEEVSFFNVDPKMPPGVNCRGGTKGAVAENHFDTMRNFVVLLKGRRRYILSAPSQCRHLDLFPDGHPSARHTRLDWSQPLKSDYTGSIRDAMSNEVVLQPGDVLYLPDLWFHYIVSLDINVQCNARSGRFTGYDHHIESCGFPLGT